MFIKLQILPTFKPNDSSLINEEKFKTTEVGINVISSTWNVPKSDEALQWSKCARLGSRYQIGNYIYIKCTDEDIAEDWNKYYEPVKENNNLYSKNCWGCGSSDKKHCNCEKGCK